MAKSKEVHTTPGERLFQVGDMTVGTVPRASIKQRRTNYRKMSKAQKEALDLSVRKFGFQSFILVSREPDGSYGVVDGHHRLEKLDTLERQDIPVLVLPKEVSGRDADLGMFTFNVSAETVDDEFAKFYEELLRDPAVSDEELRVATVTSERFMEQLKEAMAHTAETAPELEELPEVMGEAPAKKGKKPPSLKLVVLEKFREEDGEKVVEGVTTFLTHKDTVIGRDVRETLAASHIALDEIEPQWFESEGHLMEILASLSEEAEEGEV